MKKILCSSDICNVFRPLFCDFIEHHEEMWVLYVNKANKCLGVSKISQGGIDGTVTDVKIILQGAIKHSFSCIFFSPNSRRSDRNKFKFFIL
ncbi:MAG: hypothetical protein LBT27_07045 [Prevotellaceae bacterium]|nr:hypothetical protein [Prevotellaceae bacterium]